MKKVCGLTFKCRKNESCENFENYFDVIDSSHGTRNNKYSIRLPKVRLEAAKNGLLSNSLRSNERKLSLP